MLYELLKHPDLLGRAQAEADPLFARGEPTAQGVHNLDVIRRVYMETLRPYATVPRNEHRQTTVYMPYGWGRTGVWGRTWRSLRP